MKIKIKDTVTKENLLPWLMVLCALACGVLGLFGSPINWTVFFIIRGSYHSA